MFNQHAPIFFRQWDKSTNWSYANGLKSVIPGLLSLSLTGYPFVLPDMICGNAYTENADAELMIRWTQLNALLPAMQFSLAPWDYGEECAEICRRYTELHLEFTPLILKLAAEAARSGQPIVRPVAWLDPKDEGLLLCDDEFLLGDELLVAPVVHPGQIARDIYLPTGSWSDHRTGRIAQGPTVLKEYPAPLDQLPIFHRTG
jgi:alpha-glucosidase (family GH31 glycosyl hydrolase)